MHISQFLPKFLSEVDSEPAFWSSFRYWSAKHVLQLYDATIATLTGAANVRTLITIIVIVINFENNVDKK